MLAPCHPIVSVIVPCFSEDETVEDVRWNLRCICQTAHDGGVLVS